MKIIRYIFATLCIVIFIGILWVTWSAYTMTEPYLVEQLESAAASENGLYGYNVDTDTRILSVVSDKNIKVVSDPGESFKYEVIWIVEEPRQDGTNTKMEFRFPLPEYASIEHIHPSGSDVPTRIQSVADTRHW